MHFGSYLFFPSQRSREGRWLCRWCRKIWQLGLLHSPRTPFPGPEKGESWAAGPSGTPCLNSSWHMGSRILCLQGPETPACLPLPPQIQHHERGAVQDSLLWANTGQASSVSRLFHFLLDCQWGRLLSAQESFTVSLCCPQRSCFTHPASSDLAICFQLLKAILFFSHHSGGGVQGRG